MRWLHNTDMNNKTITNIQIAYWKFRQHHETDCAEQFDITLDQWTTFFLTKGMKVVKPKFKQNRIRRIDNTKPWSIDNINLLVGEAYKADQSKRQKALSRKYSDRKRLGLVAAKETKASQNRTRPIAASKPDADGTEYRLLTVADWLAEIRATG